MLSMMCEDKEIWVDIEGYDGMYQVSQYGNVRSWKNSREDKSRTPKLKALKLYGDKRKYIYVWLFKDDKKSVAVHRLVAMAFIENPCNHPWVDHIDGNQTNNHVSNLRWVNKSQNIQNTKMSKINSSGVKGVCFDKSRNTWKAQWRQHGITKSKRFDTFYEAIEYRRLMIEQHYSKEHYIEDR